MVEADVNTMHNANQSDFVSTLLYLGLHAQDVIVEAKDVNLLIVHIGDSSVRMVLDAVLRDAQRMALEHLLDVADSQTDIASDALELGFCRHLHEHAVQVSGVAVPLHVGGWQKGCTDTWTERKANPHAIMKRNPRIALAAIVV